MNKAKLFHEWRALHPLWKGVFALLLGYLVFRLVILFV